MADDSLGVSVSVSMLFAFPREEGRWTRRVGNVTFVDGHFHKISAPGIETRSGESFGITATFHVVQNAVNMSPVMRGDIARFVVQNGRLMAVESVATGVEIIE